MQVNHNKVNTHEGRLWVTSLYRITFHVSTRSFKLINVKLFCTHVALNCVASRDFARLNFFDGNILYETVLGHAAILICLSFFRFLVSLQILFSINIILVISNGWIIQWHRRYIQQEKIVSLLDVVRYLFLTLSRSFTCKDMMVHKTQRNWLNNNSGNINLNMGVRQL